MTAIDRMHPLPAAAGIGLRSPHVAEVVATRPAAAWFEVHAENYMGGGPALTALFAVRDRYPLSLHGVGLSLGSAEDIDRRHLRRLKGLVDMLQPALVSEHLAWSIVGDVYLNDLLPLPYTAESLAIVCDHVDETQETLGRAILIENPSAYLRFRHSTISEAEFLAELVRRTGCGLLCDVNNIHVSARNLGFDAATYLDALPGAAIAEIHLAGHQRNRLPDGGEMLIDHHGAPVADAVWALYARAVRRFGPRPTLIEWDTDLPPLATLLSEAAKADFIARAQAEGGQHAKAA